MTASDVPARAWGMSACAAADADAWGTSALAGIAKRFVSDGETGSAVRFACFFRILRVASVVAYWNCAVGQQAAGGEC